MTRDEKVAKARELRDEGLSQSEIARRVGVTPSAVFKWLNPDRAREYARRDRARPGRQESKNAWLRERDRSPEGRSICETCGGLCGIASRKHGYRECMACKRLRRKTRGHEIERLWAEGRTLREIRERFGWSAGRIAMEMDWLRKNGFDLPYRYAVKGGKRVAA